MKKILFTICLLTAIISGRAENYPYRSDALWVTVPNHADWLYQTGEDAIIEVQFYKYGIPRDGVVNYSVGTDLLESDHQGMVSLKNGRASINIGTMKTPGFRDLRLHRSTRYSPSPKSPPTSSVIGGRPWRKTRNSR